MASSQAPTATEYIVHHLTHLSTGKQQFIVDFSVVNIDTVFFSVACLALTLYLLHRAARGATAGVPSRFQAFVEMIVEMVEEQSKSIVHGDRSFIAPMALTVFIWVIFMNAVDLIPVDLLPWIAEKVFHIHYLRPLPTADLNGTLGMSIGVLLLMIYYAVKIKGFGGWLHELFTAPFGANPLLWPFNFLKLGKNAAGIIIQVLAYGRYFNSVIIQATTDQVTVENIVINRGQCPLSSWRKRMSTLKFGQSYQSVIDCNIEQVGEVTVKTNQGEFTFNF